MDRSWWKEYLGLAREQFQGTFATFYRSAYDIPAYPIKHYGNSGAGAIALAVHLGAPRIVLLGYDCQVSSGKAHWHKDHPNGLGNAGKVSEWPKKFQELADDHPNVEIINCSRETALTCFARGTLDEVLNERD